MKKEKSRLSVWYWGATTGYYLRHPLKWIKELFLNIRNAHDRITKGYCCLDWYDFDQWFATIAPSMLRNMADRGHGYPGREPFETPESWKAWLHKMADQLERCSVDYDDQDNELIKETLNEMSQYWYHLWD